MRRDPFARGTPIDRYYIEHFLRQWNDPPSGRLEIRGAVLEFKDTDYATLLGCLDEPASLITRIDVVDLGDTPQATIQADITDAPQLADASYDTVICTQVLHHVFEVRAAVATLARTLKVGGVLYITVTGISPYFNVGDPSEVEHWRFTADSLRRVLLAHFRPDDIVVEAYGNVLASIGFLHGLAAEEFRRAELDYRDASFPMLVGARAVRAQ